VNRLKITRKKVGWILIVLGLVALVIPFLFHALPQTETKPPAGCSSNCTPASCTSNCVSPCTSNCNAPGELLAPVTAISVTGPVSWPRDGISYFYPNFTVTLHAIDDGNLSTIVLDDTGTKASYAVHGNSSTVTFTVGIIGLHVMRYYSIDQAGNSEISHVALIGLAKPSPTDLASLIASSNIEPNGVKNALSAKVEIAQDQEAAGQDLHGLDALTSQINALEGQHNLDPTLGEQLLAMIAMIAN